MGVLNREKLLEYIEEIDYKKKLVVTPLLSKDQIGPASIDVRLGSSTIIPRKTYADKQDVTERETIREVERRLYERRRLKYHSRFVLHPNQLILGVTLEYLSLPSTLFCSIASRSSWGRLGLIIATASAVQPGFKGCLTLELVNLSESPIALYPGLLVGQLVFEEMAEKSGEPAEYTGRYDCPTEAELPKFFAQTTDKEMEFWGQRDRQAGSS